MSNPFHGVLLGGSYFNYVEGSWSMNISLKNSSQEAQSRRNFSPLGAAPIKHTITLSIENAYYEVDFDTNSPGLSQITTKGVSRLAGLRSMLGALGSSLPIGLATPDGVTHLVVPTGSLDISPHPEQPSGNGMEYRVSLTLENTG